MSRAEEAQKLEQEAKELREANDGLYRQHADEKAQMQAAMEQDRLRADELAQTVEAYSVENGQWRESYAALEEATRATEKRLEGEKRELEETIAQLEEGIESYKAQVVSDLAELERERASNEAHEQQEVELQRLIDERDESFTQLSTEYAGLQTAYQQLQQTQQDAQRAHEEEQEVKLQELAASGQEIEELQAQIATLQSQIRALNADGEVKEVNQNALLRRAEENTAEKQKEVDAAKERVKELEDELALLSLAGPGSNEYAVRLRNLQQEVFLKSEQLVQQGEKHLRLAESFETTKAQLSRLRDEVLSVRRVLLRGIGLDAAANEDDDEVDNASYKHVKLSELVRLRLKAQEHEWQLAGAPGGSTIPIEGSGDAVSASEDQAQDGSDVASCHLSNVDNFSALDALGLGGVGRLEREMRVLRSRNKRMTERTERLESELEGAQSGLRDLQSMREKVVEMAGRERVEKDLRAKSEQACKELGDKVAALSEHIEKLMVHLKHEAAAKTRAVDAQKRLERELGDTKDRLTSASRKNTAKDAQVAELEQGARILEDQLRLMDEKFIDVRNKLDYTRSAAQKESRQLNGELRALRMKWQLASDAGAFAGLPDWAGGVSLSLSPVVGARSTGSKLSKKSGRKSLGASNSDSKLIQGGNNGSSGLSPVVAAVVDDALAMGDGKRTRFEIPRLPQPEADAGTPWSDAKLSGLQRQLQSKHRKLIGYIEDLLSPVGVDAFPGHEDLMGLKELLVAATLALVAAQVFVPVSAFQLMKRDQGPLFTKSFQVRSLDSGSYAVMRNDSSKVWLVDFYAPWCPHCRAFAPQWEKVAAFYADSPNVRVGAVDCIQHKDVCNTENVMAYPQVKLYHVPPEAKEPAKMANRGGKNVKNVISWTEGLLAENDMASGISAEEIDAQLATLRKDRVSGAVTSSKGAKEVYPEDSMESKYKRLRDAGIAAVFTLENGFHAGTKVLEGERYDAAVAWVRALAASFPMEANRNALTVLSDAMKQHSEWSEEDWNKLVKKWKAIAQTMSFPKDIFVSSGDNGWALCTTYTCGLWTLFHSMTVSDIKMASPMDPLKPSEIMAAIRLFVKNFFGCEECQRHFMAANPEEKIHELAVYDAQGPRAVAMWMWLMHNKVNKVLKHGQWPAQKDCPVCYVDDREPISLDLTRLYEDEILSYLSSVYGHEEDDIFSLDAAHNGIIAAMWTSLQGFISLTAGVMLFALVAVGVKTQSHRFPSLKKMLARQHAA